MRDLARASLIALSFVLLPLPASYGATASAFGLATAVLLAVNIGLVWLSARASRESLPAPTSSVAGLAFAACGAVLVFIACRAWLYEILIYPVDAQRADMLVVIQQGIRRILQGRNPYTLYQVPWEATLPYGPVMWAPYIPAQLLHADARFVSLTGMLFVPVMCAIASAGLATRGRYATASGLLLVVAAMAFNTDVRNFVSIAHTPSYWPLLALLAWFVTRERWYAAAVTAGLLVVARTTMIAIAPVVLIAVWHRDRPRFPVATLLIGAGAAVPFLPFAIWDTRSLAYAMYGSYQNVIKGFVWTQTTWVQHSVGLTGLLLRTHQQRFMEAIQAAAMLATYAFAWRSIAGGGRPLAWMTFALLVFSWTTFWPVHYIYFDVFLLWMCAVLAETGWPSSDRVWPAWSVSLAATALVLAAVTGISVHRNPVIDVGTGAVRPLLYHGFANNEGGERTFAWIEGTEAEMLVARRSRSDATITLECQPHLPTRDSTQQISIALNGTVLATRAMREGWGQLTVDAPSAAWVYGVNRLQLSFSAAVSPRETGTGDDGRKLSAAIDRLTVETK